MGPNDDMVMWYGTAGMLKVFLRTEMPIRGKDEDEILGVRVIEESWILSAMNRPGDGPVTSGRHAR